VAIAKDLSGNGMAVAETEMSKPKNFGGAGSPEGVLAAGPGSTFRRRDGGALTSFYVKESGVGKTGWVAK
jgi:hypothetical protein